MGRRSNFARLPRDKYFTPEAAVLPLLPHLAPQTKFVEPCAGDGRLIRHLEKHGHVCVDAFDIEPDAADIDEADALSTVVQAEPGDVCITNPPWGREVFHPLILHWRAQMPTWLLHDANWLFTKQAGPFLPYIRKIVTIGRVKWIEDSKMTGKDDAVWTLHEATPGPTEFFGR